MWKDCLIWLNEIWNGRNDEIQHLEMLWALGENETEMTRSVTGIYCEPPVPGKYANQSRAYRRVTN